MSIEVRIAVMSHLSDCQEMLSLTDNREYVIKKINFVKRLLIRYKDNLNQEVSEDELNKIWSEIFQ